MSLADWAKFIGLHLRGAKGDVEVGKLTLHAETMAKLHEPFDGPGQPYAMGWVVTDRPWAGGDGRVWMHNGSNTMWFCVTWLAPRSEFAVLSTCNAGGPTAQGATDEVAALLIGEFRKRELAKAKAEAEGD
jgi:CubicO group peptidase (beta-lactamase class C family)